MAVRLPEIEWVQELAYEAGKLIRAAFYEREKETQFKLSSADLVTKTDVAVEDMLKQRIGKEYPDHKFLCEESYVVFDELTDDPTWVIDPVDGTTNFVHTLPYISVSIGVCVKKQIVLGVVYNPIEDELFYAKRGGGAYLIRKQSKSHERLAVAPKRNLEHSIVATGFSTGKIRKIVDKDERLKLSAEELKKFEEIKDVTFYNVQQLMMNSRDLRRLGSCAIDMAYVAAGRLDALAEIGIKEWDVCGGALIIEEAGGTVMNFDKTQPPDISRRQIIGASSMELALQLADILKYPSFDQRTAE